ncbi:MAG: DNA repair protein RecN [Lachnospiraceae bacterium]|nr:DNA repair protein RecN [Lachnospiraceae bacterium]
MLESLHVKNLALIDEAEVDFTGGLNILTGETGAGKSIIIGSINLALGAKADKEYIRSGTDYALVELVFSLNENQQKALEEMELPVEEDGTLILQRKIMAGRSVCKVNGESVSTGQLKMLSGYLLDMYGQHEHQSLLKVSKHREFLDGYAGKAMEEKKSRLKLLYRSYRQLEEELASNRLDENERAREVDLLSFEVNEIEAASLVPGEDEQLENLYRRMTNARRIKEAAYLAHGLTGYEENGCAGEAIGRAVRELKSVSGYDEGLEPVIEQLTEIDNLLNDFNRSMADYMESLEFDEEEFVKTEERLNTLNHLKGKYGFSLEDILASYEEKEKRLQQLQSYEEYLTDLQDRVKEEKEKVLALCEEISALRGEAAAGLSAKLTAAMVDLNFIDVDFSIEVTPNEDKISEDGYDNIEFLISTNPGEKKKPLQQVASGGELSRIMLAFKSVLADKDETDTLIFDEIDTGISGKTAWKVAGKLGQLSVNHQIICITHLPQIAAMADSHYLIEKQVKGERTVTDIAVLGDGESLNELARLLGSGSVTEAVLTNAREMKELAQKTKK